MRRFEDVLGFLVGVGLCVWFVYGIIQMLPE